MVNNFFIVCAFHELMRFALVLDVIGLLVNYSFDKSTEEGTDCSDRWSGGGESTGDGVIDEASEKQILLRNEIDGQQVRSA